MKSNYVLPIFTCLSLSLFTACQPEALNSRPQLQAKPISSLTSSNPTSDFNQANHTISPAEPITPVISAMGIASIKGNTLTLKLSLPPLPTPAFTTQLLDLSTAAKITATVKDSYGKSYTPVGADGNGQINYPAGGDLVMTFNNVRPDELLLVEAQVTEAAQAVIPQADLAAALRHTGTNNPSTTLNFQTTAVAKTLKQLLSLDAARARSISLPDLESLMQNITGRSGTAPTYTYSQRHPSLVKTSQLATALQAQNPSALTAATYRGVGATLNVTVTGLLGSDKLQFQLTDTASAIKTNLGNGSGSAFNLTGATPGSGLKLKVSSFGTPSQPYTFSVSPASLPTLTEGGAESVTITAIPDLNLTGFSPASGVPGTSVVITGSGFNASTTVQFNGITATKVFNSSTQITATVPANATDGVITVTKGSTSVNSATSFDVLRRIHVKANAVGSNNGLNWTNAYTDLQSALAEAASGDEIWLAAGTYKPHASDPNVSFVMKDGIKLYGGFVGNETLLTARNFNTNKVILSGDIDSNDDMSGDYLVNYSGNTKELIGFAGRSYTLDGVTLQGASNQAMSMGTQGSPVIRNSIFRYNFSPFGGAAIYLSTGNATLENLVFEHNLSSGTTSGAGRGGAIFVTRDGNLKLNNAIFFKNRAEGNRGNGGAVSVAEFGSQMTLTNVVFAQNSASSRGGALDFYDNITLRNVTLADNTATNGGGIYRTTGTFNAKNLLFWNSSISFTTAGPENGNITLPNASTPFVNANNPAGADGIYFTADDGLNLNNTATDAINAGVNDEANIPALDILNRARRGTAHEPGAYEYGY